MSLPLLMLSKSHIFSSFDFYGLAVKTFSFLIQNKASRSDSKNESLFSNILTIYAVKYVQILCRINNRSLSISSIMNYIFKSSSRYEMIQFQKIVNIFVTGTSL